MQLFLLVTAAHALAPRGLAFLRKQPVRCAISICKPFESACGGDGECVTDKCYDGKCGLGATCKAGHELCFTDSPHTCCTGVCTGVVVRRDCVKLLGGAEGSEGVNIDRQCDRVGVCDHWPGTDAGPGIMTTPWSVDPADNVGKYYALSGLTFKLGTTLDIDHVVSRRMGRVHENVNPVTTRPRAIVDAGVIHFAAGSYVAPTISGFHQFGDEKYCISPVLIDGAGGGYYAVGLDCCTADKFSCGDADGLTAAVVSSHLPDFAQARQILEAKHGTSYHGGGKGLETDAPLYVYWTKEAAGERNNPTSGLEYVLESNTTACVVPIGTANPTSFYAVGENCCSDTGFSCTETGFVSPDARSGALVQDFTGEYIQAVKQGDFLYGTGSVNRPIFFKWTEEVLVTKP